MKRVTLIVAAVAVAAIITLCVLPALAGTSIDGNSQKYNSSYSTTAETCYDPYSVKTGKNLTFTLSATDPDNDYLVYSATNLPPGATFDSQTGEFSWTPDYDQAGIYDVHFEVSDGSLTDAEDITITVYDADVGPETEQTLITVSSLRITPSKASTGKNINISVTVKNSGTSTGEYEVIMMINGAVEGIKTVTLAAGTAQNLKFSTSQNVAGTYLVDVNGLSGSFIIETQTNDSNPPSKGGKKH